MQLAPEPQKLRYRIEADDARLKVGYVPKKEADPRPRAESPTRAV